jgi:stress response protein YsnF
VSLLLMTIISNIIILLQLLRSVHMAIQNMFRTLIYNIKGEVVTLIGGQENNETEKIVLLWGEEIVVVREVKLGEIVIRKRKIIKSKKIDIDIKREKVIVEYPDGLKEEPNIALLESKTKFNNVTGVALF